MIYFFNIFIFRIISVRNQLSYFYINTNLIENYLSKKIFNKYWGFLLVKEYFIKIEIICFNYFILSTNIGYSF